VMIKAEFSASLPSEIILMVGDLSK